MLKEIDNLIDRLETMFVEQGQEETTLFLTAKLYKELSQLDSLASDTKPITSIRDRFNHSKEAVAIFCSVIANITLFPIFAKQATKTHESKKYTGFSIAHDIIEAVNNSEITSEEFIKLYKHPAFGDKNPKKFLTLMVKSDESKLRNYRVSLKII